MHYFLIAGEASGDLHAAHLVTALKEADNEAKFTYLGGDKMAEAVGSQPVVHYRDMAYMGFVDVARHIGKINKNFTRARTAIKNEHPDCLILIDYPSFNLRIAKFAKKLGIKVFYYIPPKVWAWKEWRVKTMKKVVDKIFAIFPFEVEFYKKHQCEALYVGNPSVSEINSALKHVVQRAQFLASNKLQDKPIVALLPGSRLGEIRENLKIMTETMRQFPQYRGVVAGAPGVDAAYYSRYTHLPVLFGQTYDLLVNARAALVTSGTATLEAALIGTPQVAMYQGGGSKMLYNIMKRVLKIPFVTLPNLIAGKQIIPELLMHLCTPDNIAHELGLILPERPPRVAMLEGYEYMCHILGDKDAPHVVASEIINALG